MMRLSSLEASFLLAAMRFYFGTATECDLLALPEPHWAELIQSAIALGVMPLLYQSLKSIDAVPKAELAQLQQLNRLNGLHNFSQTKELLRVMNQLKASGIAAIAFKGPALAISAYGNAANRQFNDLDLLVPQQDFWQAKTALIALGYQRSTSENVESETFHRYLQISLQHRDAESTLLNRHFMPSLLHSNAVRSLDLHWGIPPRRVWNVQQFERLWQHQATIEVMGQSMPTFSPEATLVIQCINVAKEPWKRSLKQICDVAQIIKAHPQLDWKVALELASELHNRRLFLLGLKVTQELLNIPLPELIAARMPKMTLALEPIFQDTPDLTPTLRMEYYDQLKTLDRPWDALPITVQYLHLMLEILLLPNQRDRELLPLPDQLSFLYYLFRPMRLLATYGLVRPSK